MTVPRAAVGWIVTALLLLFVLGRATGFLSSKTLEHVAVLSFGWAVFRVTQACFPLVAALVVASVVSMGLGYAQLRMPSLHYMPYLLVAPANLAVAWVFASGLFPGREPVLLRLIRLMGMHPVDDERFRRFIAGQCMIWASLASATALTAFAALIIATRHPWLADALTGLIIAQVVWFGVSHYYAQRRYHRPETWLDTIRAMSKPDIWQRLRAG